jgi:hypothetical protein
MSMSDINGITEEKFEPLNLMVSDDEEDKLYLEGYNLEVEDAASTERKRQVELQCQSYGKIKKYSFLQKQRVSQRNFGATPRGFEDGDTDKRGNHLEKYYRKNNYRHDYNVDYMQQYGTRPAQSGEKVYQAYKTPNGSQHYFSKKSRPAQGMTANDKNRHRGGQQNYHSLENLGIDRYATNNNKQPQTAGRYYDPVMVPRRSYRESYERRANEIERDNSARNEVLVGHLKKGTFGTAKKHSAYPYL